MVSILHAGVNCAFALALNPSPVKGRGTFQTLVPLYRVREMG